MADYSDSVRSRQTRIAQPLVNLWFFDVAIMEVLECLKKYGQRLDLEIAQETGVPIAAVRNQLAGLVVTGEVIMCKLTRFEHGKRIEAWQCRASGYFPPMVPGRKAKS